MPFTNKNNKKIPTCLSCEKFMTRLSCHGMVNKTALLREWFWGRKLVGILACYMAKKKKSATNGLDVQVVICPFSKKRFK